MLSKSAAEADQVLWSGNPRKGGGPLNSSESTYSGFGFLVVLIGRRFEFPASLYTASAACAGVVCLLSEEEEEEAVFVVEFMSLCMIISMLYLLKLYENIVPGKGMKHIANIVPT